MGTMKSTAKKSARTRAQDSKKVMLVRTNIVIDRELVDKVKQRTGATTAREAVQRALEQVANPLTVDDLRALRDLNPIRPGYDPKDPFAEDRYLQSAVAEPEAESYVGKSTKRRRDS